MKNNFWRPFLLVCVDCALVVCTHSHTKPLGGYPLGCVVWVLPCAIERVGVVDLVKQLCCQCCCCGWYHNVPYMHSRTASDRFIPDDPLHGGVRGS